MILIDLIFWIFRAILAIIAWFFSLPAWLGFTIIILAIVGYFVWTVVFK